MLMAKRLNCTYLCLIANLSSDRPKNGDFFALGTSLFWGCLCSGDVFVLGTFCLRTNFLGTFLGTIFWGRYFGADMSAYHILDIH